jgi:hydrogenase maturation protease
VRVHVIGVGSPHGDDAAGLAVAAALAARPLPPGIVVHACERPLPDLLDALEGADAAVIVDAARSGAPPGGVRRLAPGELARTGAASTHGLGVAEVLDLAAALGRAPARIEILALEIAGAGGGAPSPAVRAALAAAAEAALALACALRDTPLTPEAPASRTRRAPPRTAP